MTPLALSRVRRHFFEATALATITLLTAAPAHASGSSMPWEAPLQKILDSIEGPVAKIVAVIIITTGLTLAFGDTGGSFKLNQPFRSYKNAPFARVFRNIAQDMLNVERLGRLHDKVCSSIKEHRNATYPKISATPKFMEHRENDRGRPAEL